MNRDAMLQRTKSFALRVMKMVDHLPKSAKGRIMTDQIVRAATSVAANYRAACRSQSQAEFAHKIRITLEEADESALWLDLIAEDKLLPETRLADLRKEADELCAILFASFRTSKRPPPPAQ